MGIEEGLEMRLERYNWTGENRVIEDEMKI
jgi:hypothetical protein